jgi:2-isopropylmalate synthase
MTDKLIIFDTTLRDGEQSPGASMTREEKIRIARQLEKLRVDVIEAGLPGVQRGLRGGRAMAGTIRDSIVCGLARANDNDIRRAGEALKEANAGRIHTFIATSPIHMEKKLRMEPDQVVEQAVKAVKLARSFRDDVEFSPEDAGRSEIDFLCRILEAVIDAGATTINVPDTVGYTMPEQFGGLIRTLRERIPNSDKAVWSVHCHNDLGLAVANSLSAVMNGARQVECTINGLGERAGNASLEEIVMAVRTRQDFFPCDTRIDATRSCRLASSSPASPVSRCSRTRRSSAPTPSRTSPASTRTACSRTARPTRSCAPRTWAGSPTSSCSASSPAATRSAQRLKELGIELESEEAVNAAFKRFKDLADKKSEIFDEDLQMLVSATKPAPREASTTSWSP